MARILCKYIGCMYLDNRVCSATSIVLDPDEGCQTFLQQGDSIEDDDWENEDDLNGYDEWDDEDDYFEDSLYEDDY